MISCNKETASENAHILSQRHFNIKEDLALDWGQWRVVTRTADDNDEDNDNDHMTVRKTKTRISKRSCIVLFIEIDGNIFTCEDKNYFFTAACTVEISIIFIFACEDITFS